MGKDRWVLVDSRTDETGSLLDIWEHEQTGRRREAPVGEHPDEGGLVDGGADDQ